METKAETKALLNELIARRWSPRTFVATPVSPEVLESLFEAARWSASCFNEQPWRFIIATRENPAEFERILKLLMPKNQDWAREAPVLALSFGKRTFSHNSAANRFGLHDAGAALANLMIQATSEGLHVHAMGGFDAEGARREFSVPEDFEVGAAFAIGYSPDSVDPPPSRSRRSLPEVAFSGAWGNPAFGRE